MTSEVLAEIAMITIINYGNAMKNNIFICLFCVFLIACTHVDNMVGNPPPQVKRFLNEIIQDPDKLYNIKKNFPEYIHPIYLHKNILDTYSVVAAIEAIKSEFSAIKYSEMFSWHSKSEITAIFSDYNEDVILSYFPSKNIYKSSLLKIRKAYISIIWLKIDEHYYIYDIRGTVGEGYL